MTSLNFVFLGLSITSAWGNGHASTYRSLIRELNKLGHSVIFLERSAPWYSSNQDLPHPRFCKTFFYSDLNDLRKRFTEIIRSADVVLIGSYVPEGIELGKWVTQFCRGVRAFYDIDTPVTLTSLEKGNCDYLTKQLIPAYDLYLSFTGGPTLDLLEKKYKSPMARALYCSVDPEIYFPELKIPEWELGYLGTYSSDRQASLEQMLFEPAKQLSSHQFIVGGAQYPDHISWPANVLRRTHVPPHQHRAFYANQRYTLNVTRTPMAEMGYSPSVRLFEAAACGVPVISDKWDGIEEFFEPESEILLGQSCSDVLDYLYDLPENERRHIGSRARERCLSEHTSVHRARQLVSYIDQTRELPRYFFNEA